MQVGLNIISYEFIHEPSKTLFSGTISFEDGKRKGVRFLIYEETRAKKISAASYLENVAILKLWFATYCEFIDKWLLCYDQFDYLLGDWLLKERVKETMEQRMRDGDDLLHFQGSELIRYDWLSPFFQFNLETVASPACICVCVRFYQFCMDAGRF